MINKILLTDLYLAEDVQFSEGTKNGTPYKRASFAAFQNYYQKKEKKTELFRGTVWNADAEFVQKGQAEGRFLKGCRVEVCGAAHLNSGTDKNGKPFANIEISDIDHNSFRSDVQKNFVPQAQTNQEYSSPQGGYNQGYGQQNGYNQSFPQQSGYQNYGQQQGFNQQAANANSYTQQQNSYTQTYGQSQAYQQRSNGNIQTQNQNRPQGGYRPAMNGGAQVPQGGFTPAGVTAPR